MLWSRIIDSISGRFAFFPPTPPSYTLEPHGDGQRELSINPIVQRGHHKVSRAQVFQLPIPNNRNGDTIVAAYIAAPSPVRFTLLHSHGNAVDLGQMLPLYEQLAILLKVNVFAYDYRGYGQSSGLPAVSATLVDISTALQFLLDHFHVVPQDVVLYGQSVGSGPSSWLAARTPGLGGLVLHSPFMSGLRVLRPTATRWPSWADIYTNYKTLPKVSCRTLIMHVSWFCVFQTLRVCWSSYS